MKHNKSFSALVAGVISVGLLLCVIPAQATTVHVDGNNSVTGIDDLAVTDQFGDITVYDVEFLVTTAILLYGPSLVPQLQDENAMLGRISVIDALNGNNPLPTGAGPLNTSRFFIGAFEEEGTMVTVGGEFESRNKDEWSWCRTDCLPFGVKVLEHDQPATYASFTVSGAPPEIPVPAAVWLFGSGLLGLVGVARRKKA